MNTVFPIRYTLRLEPDLSRFRFSGRVNIELQCRQPVDTVVLNILELAVWNCMARVDDQDIPARPYPMLRLIVGTMSMFCPYVVGQSILMNVGVLFQASYHQSRQIRPCVQRTVSHYRR